MTRSSFRSDSFSRVMSIGIVALAASASAAIAGFFGYDYLEDAAIALSMFAGVLLLVVLAKGESAETQ